MKLLFLVGCLVLRQITALSVTGSISGDGNSVDKPAQEGRDFKINCAYQIGAGEAMTSCIYRKVIPAEWTSDGQEKHFSCATGPSGSGSCSDEGDADIRKLTSSISVETTPTSCDLSVRSADPMMSGDWSCHVVADAKDRLLQQADSVEVFVSNQSEPRITNPNLLQDPRQTITYDMSSSRPRIDATCTAYGGVPVPTFHWYVDDDRNEITDATFDTRPNRDNTAVDGMITFSPSLDDLCNTYDIDTACGIVNDGNDFNSITFNLICKVDQGNFYRDENNNQQAEVLVEVNGGTQMKLSFGLWLIALAALKITS